MPGDDAHDEDKNPRPHVFVSFNFGRSRYDAQATAIREATDADAVVLIVLGGHKGSGFAVQAHAAQFADDQLPALLEELAAKIRNGGKP